MDVITITLQKLASNKLTNKQNLEGAMGTGSIVSFFHLFLTPVAD